MKKLLLVLALIFAPVEAFAQPQGEINLPPVQLLPFQCAGGCTIAGQVTLSGHLLFSPDNTYDIGASGVTRPRRGYFATQVVTAVVTASSEVEAGAASGFKFGVFGRITAPSDGVFTLGNNALTDFSRLQFGGTTSSFPSLKRTSTSLEAKLADDSGYTGFTASAFSVGANGGGFNLTERFATRTAPTISSGFGVSPSIPASNGTVAFTVNVGTGGTATSGVIALPTATTGWAVQCSNLSTNTATVFVTKQTATSTTTATITNYDAAGVAAAWVASNILQCQAMGY